MVDVIKTVIETGKISINEISLNSRRRDLDTDDLILLNELYKIYSYMYTNAYTDEELDRISSMINTVAKSNNKIKIYYTSINQLESPENLILMENGYGIMSEDSTLIRLEK